MHTWSIMMRCATCSQRPTPPACGQTGMPKRLARSITASTSFTPPSRQESIWQNRIAPACISCLKITRFWHISPVATPMGATPRAIAAWPSTSSGDVGSSIHHGSNSARWLIHSMACGTSQRWLASTISLRSGPISWRTTARRRRSSARSAPTFSLKWFHPAAMPSRQRRRILSSE